MTKGIIDPTEVVRATLPGAASVARLLVAPRKQPAALGMAGGGIGF